MSFEAVWDEWVQCFRDAGMTWIDDLPPGVSDEELAAGQEALGGAPIPDEVAHIYKWSSLHRRTAGHIFPPGGTTSHFYEMITISKGCSGLEYWEWNRDDDLFPYEPFDVISLTTPDNLMIDRSGPSVGRVWLFLEDTLTTVAPDLTTYVSALVRKTKAGEYMPDEAMKQWTRTTLWNRDFSA